MGCDIHLTVELKVDGKWQEVEGNWWDDRCYDTFAILADVRNGRGFAGTKTGDGFAPIASPRGVPDDVSDKVREWIEEYGANGHSHSYHTLEQLLEYDWTQTAVKTGWVGLGEWAQWFSNPKSGIDAGPQSWSGSIGGGNVQHRTVEAFNQAWINTKKKLNLTVEDEWVKYKFRNDGAFAPTKDPDAIERTMIEELGGGMPVCEVQWEVPYFETARFFFGEMIPQLLALRKKGEVRIVFFFDN